MNLTELSALPADELIIHDETPSIEQLRDKEQLYADDVYVGMELPKYIRRRSLVEFQRWSITMENTHRLHFDHTHAINHDKIPGLLFHGTWRVSIITSWLKNWVMPNGWLWKAGFKVREMVVVGETTVLWGRVTGKRDVDGYALVDIELGIFNEYGVEGAPGQATVALPYRNGPDVPYPFVPPQVAEKES